MAEKHTFYEFFAGGGMARAGLGSGWQCLFANDFDRKKVDAYTTNWGGGEITHGDIYKLEVSQLPAQADLAWGSSPCQDLSLAGNGAGLAGQRSEAFWGFWRIVNLLKSERRAPRLLVLENVVGALTSNGGRDFQEICRALKLLGYRYGALTMDAAHFVPQSRPRLFIVATREDCDLPGNLVGDAASPLWSSRTLRRAHEALPSDLRRHWVWWQVATPAKSNKRFADLVEGEPSDVSWHTAAETEKFLSMMSNANRQKVEQAKRSGEPMIGAIYRRTRSDETGAKVQRAEVRFDGVAGCLRTPGGGSSRQFVMSIKGDVIRTRLLSGREAARLMGLPDDYELPANYNDAYHLLGDGLAVPVVRHLAGELLERLLEPAAQYRVAAE